MDVAVEAGWLVLGSQLLIHSCFPMHPGAGLSPCVAFLQFVVQQILCVNEMPMESSVLNRSVAWLNAVGVFVPALQWLWAFSDRLLGGNKVSDSGGRLASPSIYSCFGYCVQGAFCP